MPQTPVLHLPFPAESDPADVPIDLGELAAAVEAARGVPNGLAATGADGRVPAAQGAVIPLTVALPGGTIDGQECFMVDNASNPTYVWRFRYNAARIRWDFVGGAALRVAVAASETTTTIGSYVNLATLGPRITVPMGGDYSVRFGATVIDSAADSQINVGIGIGDFAAGAVLAEARGHISAANYHGTIIGEASLTGLTAGNELRVKYQHAIAGTLTVLNRFLAITPVRTS
jgi:hypothetical protein